MQPAAAGPRKGERSQAPIACGVAYDFEIVFNHAFKRA
jgi:hypothetical protein